MIILQSPNDKLQLVTSSTADIDVHASFVDFDGGSTVTPGRKNTSIASATTTDIVTSVSSGYRNVKTLHIMNRHNSTSNDVTVRHTDGTVVATLEKVTLLAGEKLTYVEGQGFRVINASGLIR